MNAGPGSEGAVSPSSMRSRVLLVLAIALALAAEVFGIAAILSIVFPGPSGEWAGLGVLAAWIVCGPIGVITLVAGLALRSGPRTLRRLCVTLSILVLLMPVAAQVIWNYHLF